MHNLLKASNIDVKPVLLSTRENGFATKIYPVISDFNYLIVNLNIDGIDFKLDKLTNEQKVRLGYVAPSDPKNKDAKNPIAELIIKNFPKGSAKIVHGHRGASYNITKDIVKMPDFKAFVSSEDYYSTLFHEMIHSTAHNSRLKRIFGQQFGDQYRNQQNSHKK